MVSDNINLTMEASHSGQLHRFAKPDQISGSWVQIPPLPHMKQSFPSKYSLGYTLKVHRLPLLNNYYFY